MEEEELTGATKAKKMLKFKFELNNNRKKIGLPFEIRLKISFGAMLKDFTREDLIELYRTMFDLPLNEDAIWSLPLQQKMISWRYYDKCVVHCLTLEACNIYTLADRKYPLSKDVCQVMLKMKLLDGKMNEVCYKLLKMIEKQAGVKK
ncbi:hypothetical protein Tco_0791145 [Tanacetum coccineum]